MSFSIFSLNEFRLVLMSWSRSDVQFHRPTTYEYLVLLKEALDNHQADVYDNSVYQRGATVTCGAMDEFSNETWSSVAKLIEDKISLADYCLYELRVVACLRSKIDYTPTSLQVTIRVLPSSRLRHPLNHHTTGEGKLAYQIALYNISRFQSIVIGDCHF